MLKRYLQQYFAKAFYPTKHQDWYASKGYSGSDHQEQFLQFLSYQKQEGSRFYDEFKSLELNRYLIPCYNSTFELDAVILTPKNDLSLAKAGKGVFFVFFQGRGEYYESRFRDMAIQARETGASVVGFNPKGFCSSTGKTEKILDIVDDGISVINFLLKNKGIKPGQIIMQGNSLGAGVQEMVSEYFRKMFGFRFRQINSNSFKSLSAVVACYYKMPLLESIVKPVLKYAGWEIVPGPDFYKTGPYRCVLRRLNDRTILEYAEHFSKVDIESDCAGCPEEYKETNLWLYEHSQIIYNGNSETDPHFLSLHHFDLKGNEGLKRHSVYKLINKYIKESGKYIDLAA